MEQQYDILIVGAGHGGAQAAIALRQRKFEGSIAIVGEERDIPYERPPLSKDYLAGERPFERILIRPATFWSDRNIAMRVGQRIVAVDPVAHTVTCDQGSKVGYGTLIWAAGGHPRRLVCEGGDLQGVHAIRTRADVDQLLGELNAAARIVVIGGGYIGLEAAAALIKLGKQVTVVEALDRVLARVAGESLSRFYEAEHRSHGVIVHLSTAVSAIEGRDGRATGVRLVDGEVLPCEIVIAGIGIVPAVEPLIAAGAAGGNGVMVDRRCRTTLPDIYAIGDCAAQENPFANMTRIRVESVGNANDQATFVARAITGAHDDFAAVPWFWSNQYDLKLQTVGLSIDHDMAVTRGEPSTRSFSVVYLKGGRVIALDCVNATRDYVQGRALVTSRTRASPERLADATVPLKEIVGA